MEELLKKIKYKIYNIDSWFYFHSPIYINLFFISVLKEWWQARKVYKFPRMKFDCGREECHFRDNNIFSFNTERLGWKWKWDYISWESEPSINITILNKIGFTLRFISPYVDNKGIPDNHLYWESMLEYLYIHNKDLSKTYQDWGWRRFEKTEDEKYDISYPTWNWNIIKPDVAYEYAHKLKNNYITVKERKKIDNEEVTKNE